ncbi:DUF3108 domain-containing protein [uncultured Dokdonia sp.]|uniref:DUF3108 domain-containing protein n=1 Tax=uncultured Dokdonia sp. TaxID=575653 RepID=UPI00261395A1|nr:DUF3108 domain-containing protein [uncultured Dokdonia sp.]
MRTSVKHIRQLLSIGVLTLVTTFVNAQEIESAYKEGEWFKFRVHYGLITAGYATLTVEDSKYNDIPVYHVKGYGETSGVSRWFFKVEDYYESYIDKNTDLPYQFIRKIDEGGHTKDKVIDFDQQNHKAHIFNRKHNTRDTVDTAINVQDMVSAFYYLRNHIDATNLKEGDETTLTMFFDKENYPFKLRFLGREVMNTEFGKIRCLKFRPLVQSGRVFKEKESLTVWVSDDENKVPIRIKASLAVGSLKADLEAFKGLKHSFRIVVDN